MDTNTAPENANLSDRTPDPDLTRLHIEYWPIARLRPYERNPRKNDEQIDKMVASIREYGFTVPVLARSETGEICDGHLRYKGAVQIGMTEVPVIPCDGWSDAQFKAFRIMANRSVTWASFDMELLALEMGELKLLDFDLSFTGFEQPEWESLLNPGANAGRPDPIEANRTLAERFGVPPFSVLDARQGYWQERKRAWLALGIQSELGRGDTGSTSARVGPDDDATYRTIGGRKPNAVPGGGTHAAGSRQKQWGGGIHRAVAPGQQCD